MSDAGPAQCPRLRRSGADIVDSVSVGSVGEGEGRNVAGFCGSRRAFGFVDFLLCNRGSGKIDGHAIVSVTVEERSLSRWQDDVHHGDGIVFEYDFVERFFFDGDGSDI